MEQRLAKVNISAAGGNAGAGARTCKVTLPNVWLSEMGIDAERRQVELRFDGSSITITPALTLEEFARRKLAAGHGVWMFSYYDGDTLCTAICADFTDETVRVENRTGRWEKTAFGKKLLPTWDDFMAFLEERCIPRGRAGLQEYLESLGLEHYAPLDIVRKTEGRMAEDRQWLKAEVLK